MSLDPHEAALWALIAISLVLVGGIMTTNTEGLGIAERGSLLAAIAGVLLAIGWRIRSHRKDGGED
jgi:energy-converting hydrogenase Eha subunit C